MAEQRRSRGWLDRLLGKSDTEFDDDWLASQRRKMKAKLGEDMSRRVTERSNVGPNVKPSKTEEAKTYAYNPNKKSVKVTKKEVSVETPTGNLGSVDRNSDVIGPDMGFVGRGDEGAPVRDLSSRLEAPRASSYYYDDPMDAARNLLAPKPLGYKKGGTVKKKACGMKSGGSVKSSASRRADGCAVRGKTKGRMV